ncbi:MAG: PEP-CTERM sorting domain-containing protein [Phycisphaerales bacterium]|nr:PEP-CTERM sorting domain-containing protein [Phycisphaerales bacterium]
MNRLLLAASAACASVVLVGSAGAATININENFETDNSPNPVVPNIFLNSGDGSSVTRATNPDSSSGSGNESAYVLKVVDGTGTSPSYVYPAFDWRDLSGIDANLGLKVSFNFYNVDSNIVFRIQGGPVGNENYIQFQLGSGGTVHNMPTGSKFDAVTTYTMNDWHSVVVTVPASDQDATKYTINLDGTDYTTDVFGYGASWATNDLMKVFQFMSPKYNAASTYYIDNVKIESIPEPGTLSLLGAGGLLLLRRRS